MYPSVHSKSFLECNEDDLQSMLDNPDYRENEYLDYKSTFSLYDYSKDQKKERQKAISELRSDVCAFANSNGGYLLYGIREDGNGIPKELCGIELPDSNTDKFELSLKNWLQTIMPKVPRFRLSFIHLTNGKYIVVLYVHHDSFAPYVHLDNEKCYRIYKRAGNSKVIMTYAELKNMFNQSPALERELQNFRRERIDYFRSHDDTQKQEYSKFLIFHIIPETFLDSSYNKTMFALEKSGTLFSSMFSSFSCRTSSLPMVDGLRYINYNTRNECRVFNSGTAEVFYPLADDLGVGFNSNSRGFFPSEYIWPMLEKVLNHYTQLMEKTLDTHRVYVCISIIGCKGVQTEARQLQHTISTIDRDVLLCNPILFEDIGSLEENEVDIKRLKLDFLLSLGVRLEDEVHDLAKELFNA